MTSSSFYIYSDLSVYFRYRDMVFERLISQVKWGSYLKHSICCPSVWQSYWKAKVSFQSWEDIQSKINVEKHVKGINLEPLNVDQLAGTVGPLLEVRWNKSRVRCNSLNPLSYSARDFFFSVKPIEDFTKTFFCSVKLLPFTRPSWECGMWRCLDSMTTYFDYSSR